MKKLFILFLLIFPCLVQGQLIYPVPHQVEVLHTIEYKGVKSDNKLLESFYSKNGLQLKEQKNKKLSSEAYVLRISDKGITIEYSSDRGKYYAYKTLVQILDAAKSSGKLTTLSIVDQPDIAFRGTVEGFYGKPWSHEDRISQLSFYGDWKLNTYIYGPKDDPYHSSPKWREPYPVSEAKLLKKLVEVAKENEVDFYWAIHPGLDIKWNKADSIAVLNKFQLMYDLGVRHFAVFFDDISGEGTKAEKQAGLLNYLQHEFVDKKKDVGSLIMCPTEYNKGWSNPKEGTYLDILGDKLDPRIHIMWTGNTVIHDITLEGQQWVNKRIKRPSFVWWNFPVSDYVRNHLLLGESYGLDKEAKSEMSGFVSNPMDKPEASKVAIFSIANYSWNLKAYNPTKTWEDAIELLFPEMVESYKLFSSHNTDPGPSYHQYRREESVKIQDILQKQLKSFSEGNVAAFSSSDVVVLTNEFAQFENASKTILANKKQAVLVNEIKPWLDFFAIQGQAALYLVEMCQMTDQDSIYSHFLKFQNLKDHMLAIDQKENRNPYQPGIVTASRHVLPWIEQSNIYYQNLLKNAGYPVKEPINQPKAKLVTSVEMLVALPIQNDVFTGNRPFQVLKLGKMLEFIPFQANAYVGLEILSNSKIREVKYKLDKKNAAFELQYSSDNINWVNKKQNDSKFVRLINLSDKVQTVKLEQFEVIFE